jgi:ActR/RegA family two-component response regulator
MNGLKLAAAAKAQRPEMNIIITTGYSAPSGSNLTFGALA